jgi:outer membrane protein with beta-barrel domain
MKLPTRVALAAVALGLSSTAVPAAAGPLIYGFRTGAASSSIRGDYADAFTSDARIGFAGSMFARYRLGSWLSLQPEVGWVSKGEQTSNSVIYRSMGGPVQNQTIDYQYDTRLDYLEIPVLLRADIPTGWFLEPYVLAGSGVGFRTGSSVTFDFTSTPASALPPGPAKVRHAAIFEGVGTLSNPRFENVDWSVIGGGGVTMGRGPIRIVMDARYTHGLAGIYQTMSASGAHNASWAATLGIELR